MRHLFFTAALASSAIAMAQITLEHTSIVPIQHLRTLTSGQYYYTYTATGFTIYNTDLTVYRDIAYPPPPTDHTYSDIRGPYLITESLFDMDPSTIEFAVNVMGTSSFYPRLRILREDGTIVFEDLDHGLAGEAPGSSDISQNGINTTADGTFMLLSATPSPLSFPVLVYRLPGIVPCLQCIGEISTDLPEITGPLPTGPEALAMPNPTSGPIEFQITLPTGYERVALDLLDASGRLVRSVPVQQDGRITVELANTAAGPYLYRLSWAGGRSAAKRVVVVQGR